MRVKILNRFRICYILKESAASDGLGFDSTHLGMSAQVSSVHPSDQQETSNGPLLSDCSEWLPIVPIWQAYLHVAYWILWVAFWLLARVDGRDDGRHLSPWDISSSEKTPTPNLFTFINTPSVVNYF